MHGDLAAEPEPGRQTEVITAPETARVIPESGTKWGRLRGECRGVGWSGEAGVPAWKSDNAEDFRALEPFFRVIEEGLAGLVDDGHFFEFLADDVAFEFIITVPGYPRRVAGRDNLIELHRGYHLSFFLDRCFDLRTHRADDSTVTLEYASEGKAVATGRPYSNRYISVVTIKDRKIVHWRDYLDPLRVFAALEGEDGAGTGQARGA
jgi:uncharacterized protein